MRRLFCLSLVFAMTSFSGVSAAPSHEEALNTAKRMFEGHAVIPLCHSATWIYSGNREFWDTKDFSEDFPEGNYAAILAKENGYDCGIGPVSENDSICDQATFPSHDYRRMEWRGTNPADYSKPEYAFENKRAIDKAKGKGLTCNVGILFPPANGSNKSAEKKPPPVTVTEPIKPPPAQNPSTAQQSDIISASSGSSFAVSKDGHLVTNNHVIEGCQKVFVHRKGQRHETVVVSYDSQNDLALLKGDFAPDLILPLATSKPQLAQDIYVSGYPFGLNISSSVKVTKGIISSLTGIGNNLAEMQIDAALQSGNSGGPILDEYGNVVGVAVAKLDVKFALENFGAIPENTNFGVKANIVEALLDANGVNYQQAKLKSLQAQSSATSFPMAPITSHVG